MKEEFRTRFFRIQERTGDLLNVNNYTRFTIVLGIKDYHAFCLMWGSPIKHYKKLELSKKKYLIKFKL